MKMIKFPSIEQFNTTIKNIKEHLSYIGKDGDGKAIFDRNMLYPTITFTGTPKGHGTNAGVTLEVSTGEIWAQSRENIITVEKDNAGFAFFVHSNIDTFKKIFDIIQKELIYEDKEYISLFGEWAGPGIQKGVGISKIDKKSLFLFDIKITYQDGVVEWYEPDYFIKNVGHGEIPALREVHDHIYLMSDMGFYKIDIDLNDPKQVQNDLVEMTNKVEENCPIGTYFGITENNVGEGIVWRTNLGREVHRFKVKGEKHSSSKVRSIAPVDTEKLNSINEFVEYACTENRMNQAIEYVFTQKSEVPDIRGTGAFLKWLVNDIIKEELETIKNSGLEPKEVTSSISAKARKWYMNYLNSLI